MGMGFLLGGEWKSSKIMVIAAQLSKYTKKQWIEPFKWVNYTVREL